MRLANKTAFITGGNSGIGLATARLFVAEGAKVAITGRNQATLEAAAKELGPNALAIVADATDIAATEEAIQRRRSKNSASSTSCSPMPASPAIRRSEAPRSRRSKPCIRTNITSVFFTVQAAHPISTTAPRSS